MHMTDQNDNKNVLTLTTILLTSQYLTDLIICET